MVKTIFTNGCFDILHRGHLELLKHCRSLGGRSGWVIVAINSDESVRRLKGPTRPIMSQNDRASLIEELRCVDEVVIFDEDTPYELIQRINPDIIVKGGDYTPDSVVGKDLAKVIVFDYVDGYSTSRIIKNISSR